MSLWSPVDLLPGAVAANCQTGSQKQLQSPALAAALQAASSARTLSSSSKRKSLAKALLTNDSPCQSDIAGAKLPPVQDNNNHSERSFTPRPDRSNGSAHNQNSVSLKSSLAMSSSQSASIPAAHGASASHYRRQQQQLAHALANESKNSNSKRQHQNEATSAAGSQHHGQHHQSQGNAKRPRVRDYVGQRSSGSRHSALLGLSSSAIPHLQMHRAFIEDQLQAMPLPLVKQRSAESASKCDKPKAEAAKGAASSDDVDAPLNLCMKRPSASSAASSSASAAHQASGSHSQGRRRNDAPINYSEHFQSALPANLLDPVIFPKKRGRKPKSLLMSNATSNGSSSHHNSGGVSAANMPVIVVPSGDNRPRKRGRPPLMSPPPNMGYSRGEPSGLEGLQMISNRLAAAGSLPTALQPGWPTISSTGQLIFPTSKSNGSASTSKQAHHASTSRETVSRHEASRPSESETDDESNASNGETLNEEDIRVPLRHGWRRHTIIRRISTSGVKGDILYFSPDGKKLKNIQEIIRYLTKNGISNLTKDNFSYRSRWLVGEFIEPSEQGRGREHMILSESEIINRIDELKRFKRRRNIVGASSSRGRKQRESTENEASTSHNQKMSGRFPHELSHQDLMNLATGSRHGFDELRILEMLQQQAMKQQRNHENNAKQKENEMMKKLQQEREAKRQQAELQKEQELQRRRELQMMAEIERERRRQHMMLVRAMDAHKKQEEREKKREEMLAEKRALQERKLAKKRLEMELMRELKKPVDDMMLKDLQPLPTLNRIPGVKLPGKAFADMLMVFEFLHNFGETLGFDMDSLPTLNTLQSALLNLDESAEDELLSVVHHLLVCAIDDPGTPSNVTTLMGTKLKDAPVTNFNISEILRLYFSSFAFPGREERPEAAILKILDTGKPFLSLNATQKTDIMSYLCNELLCNQAIVKQVDENIETVGNLRRDKWVIDCDLRKFKTIKTKREKKSEEEKEAQAKEAEEKELEAKDTTKEGEELDGDKKLDSKPTKDVEGGEAGLDEESGDSGAENEDATTSQLLDDEEPGMTNEEVDKKIDKLGRQCTMATNKLNKAVHGLRCSSLGQDRFRRRYWVLPAAGGVFVEGLESGEPEELVNNEAILEEKPEEPSVPVVEKTEEKEEKENSEEPMEVVKEEKESVVPQSDEPVKVNGNSKEDMETDEVTQEAEPQSKDEELPSDIKSKELNGEKEEVSESKTETEEVKAEVNGHDKEEDEKVAEETKDEAKKDPSKASQEWLSPIMASVLAGSMMFGQNNSGSFPFPFPGLEGANGTATPKPEAPAKPWFSIIPRIPCCETHTAPIKKESDDTKDDVKSAEAADKEDVDEKPEAEQDASALLSGLPPNFFMQAFLYPHILQSFFGQKASSANNAADPGSSSKTPTKGADGKEDSKSTPAIETPLSSSTPAPAEVSAIATIEELVDICPSLQRKLAEQKEKQHLAPQRIPREFQCGWWRITDPSQLRSVNEVLNDMGVRERQLQKHLQKYFNYITLKCKSNVAEFDIDVDLDRKICDECPFGAALPDVSDAYSEEVACRLDVAVLEQIEALEEKIANSSMQIRGWRPTPKLSADANVSFEHSQCEPLTEAENRISRSNSTSMEEGSDEKEDESKEATSVDDEQSKNPVDVGRERLLGTEAVIERRYLKPPLGYKSNTIIINPSGVDEYAENAADENAPSGLIRWREAVRECRTGSQLALLLHFLETCIAWDKSIMRASCQFCSSGENEAQLLLCDGCDRGYHMYCFKPKMENIPEGDWFCFECQNKNTIDKVCIVCGKKGKLLNCDTCPKVFHPNCIDPPVSKPPKGKWSCHMCIRKPRKYTKASRKPPAPTVQPVEEKPAKEAPAPEPTPEITSSPTKDNKKGKGKGKKGKPVKSSPVVVPEPVEEPETKAEKDDKPKSKDTKKNKSGKEARELAACDVLLAEMEKHDEAWPFLHPVNTKQFPTYKKIIKKPMDVATIRTRLETGVLKNKDDFRGDVQLIFDNCETFNEDESPVGQCGHSLRAFFEKRWDELVEKA